MTSMRVILVIVLALTITALIVSVLASRDTAQRIAQLEKQHSLIETRHGLIEYLVWGEGTSVLVVHGAGGGFDQGRLLAEAIGRDRSRFISVSRFGYLGSDLPADASIYAQAEAFVELLDGLDVGPVHVLAMSGGVPPSLKSAELFPKRTGRLVLISSAPFTPFGSEIDDRPVPAWGYSALLGNDIVYWTFSKVARGQLRTAFDARDELWVLSSREEAEFVEKLLDGFDNFRRFPADRVSASARQPSRTGCRNPSPPPKSGLNNRQWSKKWAQSIDQIAATQPAPPVCAALS